MNYQFSGNPKPFAIIGLVFAIFAFLFSLIPCIGFYAVGPSLMSLAFSGISYAGLKQRNQSTSLSLAGLIVGAVAISVGIFQYYKYETLFDAKSEIEKEINVAEKHVLDTIGKKVLEHAEQRLIEEIERDSIVKMKMDSIQKVKNDSVTK